MFLAQTEIIAVDGINNSGQVVGSFDDASGQHGFVDDHGQFTTIDYPGVTHTSVNGINAGGQVIGSAESPAGPSMVIRKRTKSLLRSSRVCLVTGTSSPASMPEVM